MKNKTQPDEVCVDKSDCKQQLPAGNPVVAAADEQEESLIASADIIKGEICEKCGFRCIQGCV